MKINVRNDPPFMVVNEELNASISDSKMLSPSSAKTVKEGVEDDAGDDVNEGKTHG